MAFNTTIPAPASATSPANSPYNDKIVKQFTVMAGISHASFQQKNYLMVYHILHAYFTRPAPAYVGNDH